MKKTIGIIGGMGPAATSELFSRIIKYTEAKSDNEHIHILIDNNTDIPDRTNAILHGGPTPVPMIINSANNLVSMGADFLIMPCNTSHFYYHKVMNSISVPLINMIQETACRCYKSGISSVGVLATDGTRSSALYDKVFSRYGIKVYYPCEDGQAELMNIIYNRIKANRTADTSLLGKYLSAMSCQGVEAFILACTELPLVLKNGMYGCKFIDTLDILADCAIIKAGYFSTFNFIV